MDSYIGRASYSEVNNLNEDEREILNRIATRVSGKFVSEEAYQHVDGRNSNSVAPVQTVPKHIEAPLKMDKSTSSDDLSIEKSVEDNGSLIQEIKTLSSDNEVLGAVIEYDP
eukprot:746660-Hanusia_phi.AAC.7